MKLARYGLPGQERPALVDPDGQLRDLSALIPDLTATHLTPETLDALRALDPYRLPLVSDPVRLGAPFTGTQKFIAIGLNYRDHAREANLPIPERPVVFLKATSTIQGPNDPIIPPPGFSKLDFEVELGVVIGCVTRQIPVARALDAVAGYCLINDVSERALQMEAGGGQWALGKSCDTFGTVGPWLVTKDEIPDPQALTLWLDVNGERRQTGHTREMIFTVAQLISYLSHYMTLTPGDVIATGTPAGVAMGENPPRYLQIGDTIHAGCDLLGEQRQRVLAPGSSFSPC
ncbi:fumarylacetoacetate hydrolase family protein [Hydrogenophilus thermoluteolus]|uniref:fumarylacetoacetate hydrolase family protein n=1 Tax=Hydrogenophilus thermoluteolus TaxID=297 RepID=UPI003F681581